MTQAQFYYRDKNAPKPDGNRIGTCILIGIGEKGDYCRYWKQAI